MFAPAARTRASYSAVLPALGDDCRVGGAVVQRIDRIADDGRTGAGGEEVTDGADVDHASPDIDERRGGLVDDRESEPTGACGP